MGSSGSEPVRLPPGVHVRDLPQRDDDLAVSYADPAVALDWYVVDPVLSPRDRAAPTLAELLDRLATEGVVLPTIDA